MNTTFYSAPSLEVAQVLLSLSRLKGMRNRKALELFSKVADKLGYLDPRDMFLSLASEHVEYTDDHEEAWTNSVRWLAEGQDAGLEAIPFFDQRYPGRLREIDDPPAVLFAKGRIEVLNAASSVAIVGTRKPTQFGERAAQKAGRFAAESGIVVVSGLALGCDAKAHEGCVEGRGLAIAVLAHGLDKVYPAANRDLAEQILGLGGCLVSELPIGVKPARWTFAYRDRIQSGLSDGVLVIETDVKGGTMHTVDFSQKQRRSLACIDHPPQFRHEVQAQGNRKLINQGTAVPIADQPSLSRFLAGIEAPSPEKQQTEPTAVAEQLRLV